MAQFGFGRWPDISRITGMAIPCNGGDLTRSVNFADTIIGCIGNIKITVRIDAYAVGEK